MKTIKIDKNSKVIKFLTADADYQPLFGFIAWRPEPYKEDSWSKPLPEDTCSLRKALIAHAFKCICGLITITLLAAMVLTFLLSALIVTPYEICAGIFMVGKGTIVGAMGFSVWVASILSGVAWVSYVTKEAIKSLIKRVKRKNYKQEKQVDSVFGVLYNSLKNKLCSKIEYIEHVEKEKLNEDQ